MICRKCSFILQGSEKFCPNCGTPCNEKPQTEKEETVETPTPPSILFSAPKQDVDVPQEFKPRFFNEETMQEELKPERKKNKAPAVLIALLVLLVVALGGFTAMEYFDLAPAIMQYLETGMVTSEEESTQEAYENIEAAQAELPAGYGTVTPDINFKSTICYVASGKSVALRKGPDNSYALLQYLPSETKLQVLGASSTNDTWVYAYVPSTDTYGWVSASYLGETDLQTTQEETTYLTQETTATVENSESK